MGNPVILVGMHRSGTSLVTRLLQQLGLFVGWDLSLNAESVFFVSRNSIILEAQGGRWDTPAPLGALFQQDGLRKRLVLNLRRDLRTISVASYLGPLRFLKYRSILLLDFPWGWKDPRNTLLLPLWLDVFPKARVIHVVRNGVDVALSLSIRETRRLQGVLSEKNRRARTPAALDGPGSYLSRIWIGLYLRTQTCSLRRRYERLRIHSCIDMKHGFALWEEYVERATAAADAVGSAFCQVRFEDLLAKPKTVLRQLAAHCRLEASDEQVAQSAQTIDPSAGYRFREDPNGAQFYRKVRGRKWMERFGYDSCGVTDRPSDL